MKVFLSSTAQDLGTYRQVADDTILRLSQQAVAMERFRPLPGGPAEECERLARECDVTVCIVAHRYGFEPEKGLGSITRREVEAAKAAGRDVLVWIVADDHPWTEKKEQDLLTDPTVLADPALVADVAAGVAALIEFKAWLRKTFTPETFTTSDDLGRKIAVALSHYATRRTPSAVVAPTKRGEVRIVHALQPAPHFRGRDAQVKELTDWVNDVASPDRVWSLVAAGGTGKTAIVERVVREMRPGEANVLVWSFYERPEADAFLRECNHLFLGEEEGPAGGRLERLERGLRDGRPHLIVLDGLERVQDEAGAGRVRGELTDHTLKLLLRVLAAGLGRARALVTSRFPLVDLQDWTNRGYRDTRLDDLTSDAAVAVLRGWGVVGYEAALRAAAFQVGHHALSVAVIGSYLRSFANGRIEEVACFNLDAVTGDDPKAAKLARVLAFYAERLPVDERELMARLSVFPRGVSVELLGTLVEAGGDVAGALVTVGRGLRTLLNSLKARGLVSEYQTQADISWTTHPFLREKFRGLLDCPAEQVFEVVAGSLHVGLEKYPSHWPSDTVVLDKYERLIEATRLAGREQEAIDLFDSGMGGFAHVGKRLGEYQRGYRILVAFSPTGLPEHLGQSMSVSSRILIANALALFAIILGRLEEASSIQQLFRAWQKNDSSTRLDPSVGLTNSCATGFRLGRLRNCLAFAEEAMTATDADHARPEPLAHRARAAHASGDIASARRDFATALQLSGTLHPRWIDVSLYTYKARHHLDLGELAPAQELCSEVREVENGRPNRATSMIDALLGRIAVSEGRDPTPYIEGLRIWTSRSGDIEKIIEAHLLSSQHLLTCGDAQAALGEAETGLLHAVACGYRLLRIEVLVAIARIRLAWPDPAQAIRAAREALDLATHTHCQYAWGEADAAQVWGEAYSANHEPALAHRAFTQALAVRKRIEHPGVADTEKWLAMTVV